MRRITWRTRSSSSSAALRRQLRLRGARRRISVGCTNSGCRCRPSPPTTRCLSRSLWAAKPARRLFTSRCNKGGLLPSLHCDNIDVACFAQNFDRDGLLVPVERQVDRSVSDPEIPDPDVAQGFGQGGVMEINARLPGGNSEPQTRLQHQEDGSGGPGLRRAGHRIKGRALGVPAVESADELGQSMESDEDRLVEERLQDPYG